MDDASDDQASDLISQPPQQEDVVRLCRKLNRLGENIRCRAALP